MEIAETPSVRYQRITEARPANLGIEEQGTLAVASSAMRKRIWIDLDNSPHVPFFKPIAEELERRGYSVMFTARDCFQVRELADLMRLKYDCVGRHYGKHTLAKVVGMGVRAVQLFPHALRWHPHLAVSHGSRSMFALASAMRIPTVTIMDYEHVRWTWLPGKNWALLPEIIPSAALKLRRDRILKYPGIKEDVYAPSFRPSSPIKRLLKIGDQEVVVTLRPPANEAHYHNAESEVLLDAVFEMISRTAEVKVVLVPRTSKQEAELRVRWRSLFEAEKVIVPKEAVDGLNLIWFSDLVISGGGTMNREAAALGVPVYSIFRGTMGAVDQYLAESGRLIMLQSAHDVNAKLKIVRRQIGSYGVQNVPNTLDAVVRHIIAVAESQAAQSPSTIASDDRRL